MEGRALAREARRRGLGAPIVVVSAASDVQAWCDEIGADGCLPKPFELDDLLVAVERFMPDNRPG